MYSTGGPPPLIISKGPSIISRSHRIPGTFPSARYGEQVLSTGIPSLDGFIGGGIPLGTVCVIKDTFPSRFGDCVLKTFIAEGVSHGHHVFIGSGQEKTEEYFVSNLPSLAQGKGNNEDDLSNIHGDHTTSSSSSLKIAWRYGHQSNANRPNKDITKFDFSKKTSASELANGLKLNVKCSQVLERKQNSLEPIPYRDLLKEIAKISKHFTLPFADSSVKQFPSNILRICLSRCEDQVLSPEFMMGLRAVVRHTNSCAMLIISDLELPLEKLERCQHFSDYFISLQAVTDEKRRTELGDIDGICDIVKIVSINTLKLVEPPSDLGFSFKKKRLLFHELNLPPEGENTAQREVSNNKPSLSSSSTCGTTIKGKSIDF